MLLRIQQSITKQNRPKMNTAFLDPSLGLIICPPFKILMYRPWWPRFKLPT